VAQHNFWQFHDPEIRETVIRWQEDPFDPIEGVYRYADDVLGSVLAEADERTTVILVSDHGAGAWEEEHDLVLRLWQKQKSRKLWMGNHRIDGILAMWGRDAARGVSIEEPVGLLDMAPTVLYLMGFPVADDMPGRVIEEGIRPDVLESRPVATVPSFETRHRRSEYFHDPVLDRSIEEELKSLGYLN
jgi:arylsulfatase A-like enzyme